MATPEQIASVKTIFPAYSWMLDVPELATIISQAADEQWQADRIQGALQGTDWFKQRNSTARQWQELQATDPAEATRQQQQLAQQMLQWANTTGIKITADEAGYVAGLALGSGQTTSEWQGNLFQQFVVTNGQTPVTIAGQLKAKASAYAVPLADSTLQDWEKQIATGAADLNVFDAYMREQAKSLFPSLSNAIDRGITVDQYADPYKQIAVQELGINPAEVDWTDPKWSTALHQIDPKTGNPVSMSLSDWTTNLRTNDVYGFDQTAKAQAQAAQLSQAMLQKFGKAA